MRNQQVPHVRPIEEPKVQFRKVTKHLYDPMEAWALVIANLPDCVGEAERAGCGDLQLLGPVEHRWDRACATCQSCVCGHHDQFMMPAYLKAVREPASRKELSAQKTGYVGRNGVFVLVSSNRAVLTAYRIKGGSAGSGPVDNQLFVRRALRYLQEKALEATRVSERAESPIRGRIAQLVGELSVLVGHDLELNLPTEIDEERARWLLALLYQGQTLRSASTELQAILAAALHRQVTARLVARTKLPPESELLESLQQELDDTDEPLGPLFDRLIDIEWSIAALAQCGESAGAQRLARRAAALLTRYPKRTAELMPAVHERLATYREDSKLTPLWQAIVQEKESAHDEPALGTAVKQLLVQLLDQPLFAAALKPRFAAQRETVVESGRNWFAVYLHKQRLTVHVLLPKGMKLRDGAVLRVVTARAEETLPVRVVRQKRGEVWMDLGDVDALGDLMAPIRSRIGEHPVLSIHVELDLESEADVGDSEG